MYKAILRALASCSLIFSLGLSAYSQDYKVERQAQGAGGLEESKSNNYTLSDTIGETAPGPSKSDNFELKAGYRRKITNSILSISCPNIANIGSIVGDGQGTTEINCKVHSLAEDGYTLLWSIRDGSSGSLVSEHDDAIEPYTADRIGFPESWHVSTGDAEWGGRLKSDSTDYDPKWGLDGESERWLDIPIYTFPLVHRSAPTKKAGSNEILQFRVEIGSERIQPSGKYVTEIVITLSSI